MAGFIRRSSYYKDLFRLIWNNKVRFLSILVISALGVGFFAGLRATSPNEKFTVDKYFNDSFIYDMRIISTLGFDSYDIDAIAAARKDFIVYPSYTMDAFATINGADILITFKSYRPGAEINLLALTQGRLPENAGECVVDSSLSKRLELGAKLVLSAEENGDISESLEYSEYTIVGFAHSAMYVNSDRGFSNKGSGKVDAFVYLHEDAFTLPYYTEVFLRLADGGGFSRFDGDYDVFLDDAAEAYNEAALSRADDRYQSVRDEAVKTMTDMGLTRFVMEIQLRAIKKPEWYVFPVYRNAGLDSFRQDADRIQAVAEVIPFIFYLVAILVTLTQMSRIVEDDRSSVGIQKSLGYGTPSILFKYVFYALLASLGGGLAGLAIGINTLPSAIYNAYRMMYTLPGLVNAVTIMDCIPELLSCLLCTLIPTVLVSAGIMRESAAELMRPKAPPMGRRIFLEYVSPVWKRLKFNHKVTARNLFRFKKRLYMTIAGISGCTALLLTGFGLYDSIVSILDIQYGDIMKNDFQIVLQSDLEEEDMNDVYKLLDNDGAAGGYAAYYSKAYEVLSASGSNSLGGVYIMTFSQGMSGYIDLRERKSGAPLSPDANGVIISEKLSRLLDVDIGDSVKFLDSRKIMRTVPVAGICENYTLHYIYITPELFGAVTGSPPFPNMIMGGMNDLSAETKNAFSKRLLSLNAVNTVLYNTSIKNQFTGSLDALNSVVWIILLASAILAFVVLFSLNNISIDERIRELATLKVLGFFDNEAAMYIFRENTLLTVIGTAAGLFLGRYLHLFIIKTVEIDILMFSEKILPLSYVLSSVITLAFSIVVSLILSRRIKSIDMVESLKSVE